MFGTCEMCVKPRMLEEHHVWGGSLRKKSEAYGAVAKLCVKCHREGKKAVHKAAEQSMILKAKHQKRIMREYDWTTEHFIFEFGRNYL